MDNRSRKALTDALAPGLPSGFVCEGDDFLDYVPEMPMGHRRFCRVVRFAGSSRVPVLFSYPSDPLANHSNLRDYRLRYLHEDGSLVPFDAKALTSNGPGKLEKPWDTTVGAWLVANEGQQFKGANWPSRLATVTLMTLIPLWEREHSGRAKTP